MDSLARQNTCKSFISLDWALLVSGDLSKFNFINRDAVLSSMYLNYISWKLIPGWRQTGPFQEVHRE